VRAETTSAWAGVNARVWVATFADVRNRVGSNSAGLFVLAGEATPARRRVLDPAIYREAVSREEGLRRTLAWYADVPAPNPKAAGNLDYEAEDAALVTIRGPAVH